MSKLDLLTRVRELCEEHEVARIVVGKPLRLSGEAGPAAEAFLKRYRADWLFLGCAGVDAGQVTNYDEAVLASERLMIERSAKLVLLADHTKVGRTAMCQLCGTKELNHFITGPDAPRQILRQIAKARVGVITVSR